MAREIYIARDTIPPVLTILPSRTFLTRWLPLALIVLVGAALRLYRIGELPPGLYRDEAFYGLDALNVLRGDLSVYFVANNGREGLFMYWLAAAILLFGRTPEALRIASAAIGTLTIIAIYFTGRVMFSHRVGVLSAAVLAVNFWHMAISRVAFRAITLPLVLCVLMALVFAALRTNQLRPRLIYAALAGGAFGLTLYTYTSAQMVIPLFALYAASLWVGLRRELFVRRSEETAYRRRMSVVVFVVTALITLAPLLMWLTQHGNLYFNRASQVSILNPDINGGDPLGTLLGNVVKAVGMFVWQGDRIWRHNLSLRPAFDGFMVVAFIIGVAVCAWRWLRSWQSRYGSAILGIEANVAPQFLLLWLIVFLIPTILAEDTPHYLRAIGALPAACIVAAVGLEAALAFASRRGWFAGLTLLLRRAISPPAFVAALVIAISGVNTITDYFNDYVTRPITSYWLEAHNTALAREVNEFLSSANTGDRVLVDKRLASDNPALLFLAPSIENAQDRGSFVEVSTGPQQPGMAFGRLLVDSNHDWSNLRDALPAPTILKAKEGPLAQGDKDNAPRRAFISVDFTDGGPQAGQPAYTFERGLGLLSAVVTHTHGSNVYSATLTWSTTQPISDDLAVFVHWVRDGQVLVQSDNSPANGYLPMPFWRTGDWIVDEHALAVPGGAMPGDEIHVGAYRREGNQRLSVLSADGKPEGDSVIISPPP
jgi:4-amino-4-deoxy-L-arabinose transferase-like glycosyltransferase